MLASEAGQLAVVAGDLNACPFPEWDRLDGSCRWADRALRQAWLGLDGDSEEAVLTPLSVLDRSHSYLPQLRAGAASSRIDDILVGGASASGAPWGALLAKEPSARCQVLCQLETGCESDHAPLQGEIPLTALDVSRPPCPAPLAEAPAAPRYVRPLSRDTISKIAAALRSCPNADWDRVVALTLSAEGSEGGLAEAAAALDAALAASQKAADEVIPVSPPPPKQSGPSKATRAAWTAATLPCRQLSAALRVFERLASPAQAKWKAADFGPLVPEWDPGVTPETYRARLVDAARLSRREAATVYRTKAKSSGKRAARRLRRRLNASPKLGHRAIFSRGTTAAKLDAVRLPGGSVSSAGSDILRETVRYFYTLQSPHHSASKTDPPWQAGSGWHGPDPIRIESRGDATPIFDRLDWSLFMAHVRRLPNNKAPGDDGILYEVIRLLPDEAHRAIFGLFQAMAHAGVTPAPWKSSRTVLLPKAGDPTLVKNYRPIALMPTVYKLWTGIIARLLQDYSEEHNILHHAQEGFRRHRGTHRQLAFVQGLLEDAHLKRNPIYALYVDFSAAYNCVPHAHLLDTMDRLGFPPDAVAAVRGLYTGASTRVSTPVGATDPIPVECGVLQGDTLSPFLFLIFLEPLLRWLHAGDHGYTPACAPEAGPAAAAAYADDILLFARSEADLHTQAKKIRLFSEWSGMAANPSKCACTSAGGAPPVRTPVTLCGPCGPGAVPSIASDAAYKYLGIQLCADLDPRAGAATLRSLIKDKGALLSRSPFPSARQRLRVANSTILGTLRHHCAGTVPTRGHLRSLDRLAARPLKRALGLSISTGTWHIYRPTRFMGMGATPPSQIFLEEASKLTAISLRDGSRLAPLLGGLLREYGRRYGSFNDDESAAPNVPEDSTHRLPFASRLALMHRHGVRIACDQGASWGTPDRDCLFSHIREAGTVRPVRGRQPLSIIGRKLLPLWSAGIYTLGQITSDGSLIAASSLNLHFGKGSDDRLRSALNWVTLQLGHWPNTPEAAAVRDRVDSGSPEPIPLPFRRVGGAPSQAPQNPSKP